VTDEPAHDQAISFGPFLLFPKARVLKKDGASLHIGGRALDILIHLAERPGEVVDKRDLMRRVWAKVNVDEGSLRFHVTGLRKALSDRAGTQYVKNVPGRGYCFAIPPAESRSSDATPSDAIRTHNVPAQIVKLIGRTEPLEKISAEILRYPIVTIVGPGGIGKTSVAVAVAHRIVPSFQERVFFVDFGALTDAGLVPDTIVSALGLTVSSRDPVPRLLTFLRGRRILLIFDCCEHVLDSVAPLVERIARESTETHILATSREALRVETERVFRLFPLDCPPSHTPFKIADVSTYPATALFVERVTAASGGLELGEEEAPLIAEICQRLDGIPLAIELAAGRVNAYGIAGAASLLDSHLSLLWRGRRTSIPRHQTLSAALGWSYDLLSPAESATLRRLSAFAGPFTLDAAVAIGSDRGVRDDGAAEVTASLVSKSLISMHSERPLRYRLLDTTRAFAREKLTESGEADEVTRAHAEYFTDFLKNISSRSTEIGSDNSFLPYADQIANVRSALEWSFSTRGDSAVGVNLAASAAPFFLELSLLTECHRWMKQAIAAREATPKGDHEEMVLQAALGLSVMFTQGNTEAVRSTLMRSLRLAEQLGDPHWQIWLLIVLQIYHIRIGDFQSTLRAAEQAESIAKELNDPDTTLYVEWLLAVPHHMLGNQRKTIELTESAAARKLDSGRPYTLQFGYDYRTFGAFAFARALWLTGWPDRATDTARYAVDQAERLQQPLNLSLALLFAIPVFIWFGDWDTAESMIDTFVDHTARHALAPHHAVGIGFRGELLMRRGNVMDGIDHLCRCRATLHTAHYRMLATVFATALAEARAQLNQFDEALRVIDAGIAQIGESGETFYVPEMLRIKGHALRSLGYTAEAEECLQQSIELSRKQGALGWELRSALTLGELWRDIGRPREARHLIELLYKRYSEGHASRDLVAARRFLDTQD
jgi:predicted ATPase/DNA-binding winged helix-turn-helix (wHTH) protein